MEYYYRKQGDCESSGPYSETDIVQYQEHQIFVPVYNYSAQDYVLETLQQKRLKLSLPSKMNDPFECLPAWPDTKDVLSEDKLRESMDRTTLFRSFTKYQPDDEKDNLLWSHYADKHTGVRIGYAWKVQPNCNGELQGRCYFLEDINYVGKRPVIPDNLPDLPLEELRQFALNNAKAKSRSWKYEDEVRLFVVGEQLQKEHGIFSESTTDGGLALMEYPTIEENGMTFLKFESDNIFSIDFGCQCSDDNFKQAILNEVKTNYPHVVVCEAVKPKTGYVLEYQQIFP